MGDIQMNILNWFKGTRRAVPTKAKNVLSKENWGGHDIKTDRGLCGYLDDRKSNKDFKYVCLVILVIAFIAYVWKGIIPIEWITGPLNWISASIFAPLVSATGTSELTIFGVNVWTIIGMVGMIWLIKRVIFDR